METSSNPRCRMWTSADTRRPPAPRVPPANAGFTLLEVMATLAIVALLIVPILQERETASNMAFRSGHMMMALAYSQQLLADRTLDRDPAKELQGVVETDPDYRWELTIEEFDLSTGRVVEPEDQQGFTQGTNFSTTSGFNVPGDAGVPPDGSEQDSAHRVRRYKLTMYYPSLDDEQEGRLVLEGFLPLVVEEDTTGLLGPAK